MENASKALIIAGAILISILLISVGIMVMNAAGAQTEQVESTSQSQAIQSFNSRFSSYESQSQTATQTKALISALIANNVSDKSHQIYLTQSSDNIKDNSTTPAVIKKLDQLSTGIDSSTKYTISFTYAVEDIKAPVAVYSSAGAAIVENGKISTEAGYICAVEIKEK